MKFGAAGINYSPSHLPPSGEVPVLLSVRVKDIILDQNHKDFEQYGGWNGIGTIFWDEIKTGGLSSLNQSIPHAYPYFSNLKFYPLIGETVSLLNMPNPDLVGREGNDREEFILYYLPPANLWNSPHHNVSEDQNASIGVSKKKSYSEVESGLINREHKTSKLILFGDTFKQRTSIPLYPYEGDHIIEGRWGNSIRLSSTVNKPAFPNTWSSIGQEGDPLIILSNTLLEKKSNFEPRIENINGDLSSIYLTSTQKIPFTPSSFETNSFGKKDFTPSHPQEYQKDQIIINSGRLILNSRTDSVLISSPEVIHLSTGGSIHLDTNNKIVLSSGELYLISRNATEPAVLGNKLESLLKTLIQTIRTLQTALAGASNGGGGVPSLNGAAGNLGTAANTMETQLKDILSNKVKLL